MKNQNTKRVLQRALLSCAILLAGAGASQARWAMITEPVPTERVVANIKEYVQKNPKDAHGYYVLGRVHSLAFAQGGNQVDVVPVGSVNNQDKNLPSFAGYQSVRVTRADAAKAVDAEAIGHLRKSVFNYSLAAKRDDKNALYFLGLGWMLEQGAPLGFQAGTPWPAAPKTYTAKSRELLKKQIALLNSDSKTERDAAFIELGNRIEQSAPHLARAAKNKKLKPTARERIAALLSFAWQQRSLAAYRRAYELKIGEEIKGGNYMRGGDYMVGLEAGQGILRLLASEGDNLNAAEKTEKASVEKNIQTIEALPQAMTPILIPMGKKTKLAEMLAPETIVSFDLAGDARGAKWSWVRPDTGILVWDPKGTGKITSGRQLFGNATWWLFFRDGYEALSALDDDGNGWLEGKETKGLAIWRDADGNGISDAGEVLPLAKSGVEALAVKATKRIEGVLQNANGARMKSGKMLPTYDWIVEPHIN